MDEYIYIVVNEKDERYTGWNKGNDYYATLGGAKQVKRRMEEQWPDETFSILMHKLDTWEDA